MKSNAACPTHVCPDSIFTDTLAVLKFPVGLYEAQPVTCAAVDVEGEVDALFQALLKSLHAFCVILIVFPSGPTHFISGAVDILGVLFIVGEGLADGEAVGEVVGLGVDVTEGDSVAVVKVLALLVHAVKVTSNNPVVISMTGQFFMN